MIVVNVEMWPNGFPQNRYNLSTVLLENVGGDARKGDYKVVQLRKGSRGVVKTKRVDKHPRLSKHVLVLVRKSLESLGY